MDSESPIEGMGVLAILPPIDATSARTSAYVKPSNYHRLAALVMCGAQSASGTLTLIKAASTTGASSASIATAAYGGTATTDDDAVHLMSLGQASDFFDETRPYYAIEVGDGPALTAAVLLGFDSKYKPPIDNAAKVTLSR